jgi:hypothetical protein
MSSSLAVVQSTSVGQTNSSSWRCLTEPATVTVEFACRRCGRRGDDGGGCDPASVLAFESDELGFVPSAVILQLSSTFSSSTLFCCHAAARKRSSRSCFVSCASCPPNWMSSLFLPEDPSSTLSMFQHQVSFFYGWLSATDRAVSRSGVMFRRPRCRIAESSLDNESSTYICTRELGV